jgi:hypothetical protein
MIQTLKLISTVVGQSYIPQILFIKENLYLIGITQLALSLLACIQQDIDVLGIMN